MVGWPRKGVRRHCRWLSSSHQTSVWLEAAAHAVSLIVKKQIMKSGWVRAYESTGNINRVVDGTYRMDHRQLFGTREFLRIALPGRPEFGAKVGGCDYPEQENYGRFDRELAASFTHG